MNKEEILKRVITLFSAMSEAEEITEESELIEDLGVSSMDIMMLMTSLEDLFKIKIPEKSMRKIATIGDVAEVVQGLLQNQ